ncbi:hypothetical protein EV363DRAFT_1100069, partial [Boletus edulis]
TLVFPSRTYDAGGNQPQCSGKWVPSVRNALEYSIRRWDLLRMGVTRRSRASSQKKTPAPACPTDEASLPP